MPNFVGKINQVYRINTS